MRNDLSFLFQLLKDSCAFPDFILHLHRFEVYERENRHMIMLECKVNMDAHSMLANEGESGIPFLPQLEFV